MYVIFGKCTKLNTELLHSIQCLNICSSKNLKKNNIKMNEEYHKTAELKYEKGTCNTQAVP